MIIWVPFRLRVNYAKLTKSSSLRTVSPPKQRCFYAVPSRWLMFLANAQTCEFCHLSRAFLALQLPRVWSASFARGATADRIFQTSDWQLWTGAVCLFETDPRQGRVRIFKQEFKLLLPRRQQHPGPFAGSISLDFTFFWSEICPERSFHCSLCDRWLSAKVVLLFDGRPFDWFTAKETVLTSSKSIKQPATPLRSLMQ